MSSDSEKVDLKHARSFRQNRRARHDSDERPQSLISYETKAPNTKLLLPPVLAKARGSLPNDQYFMERRYSLSALDDIVQCPICLDRLNQPKMLPCQHTFCLSCLQNESNNSAHKNKSCITCSTCGLKHELKNWNDLPSNLYIVSLLKVMNNRDGSGTSTQAAKSEADLMQMRCVKCQTIYGGDSQWCRHCLQTFCMVCWDSHMVELNQQIKAFDNKLNTAEQKMNHKLEDCKVRHEKMGKQINMVIEGKIDNLRKQQKQLLDNSEVTVQESVTSHKHVIDKINSVKQEVETCANNPNSDKVAFFMAMHKEITEILKEIFLWGEDKPTFNQNTLTIEVAEKPSQEDLSDDEIKKERKKSIPEFSLHSPDNVEDYYKRKEFKSKVLWTKCIRPAGVAIAPWTLAGSSSPLLYIVGSDTKAIFVVDKTTGHFKHKITFDQMICPHGIAFSSERAEIYISDKWRHCIFVFSRTGEFLRFIGSKGDMEGCLRSPEGLAIGPNNSLFVADTGNDRIQCLDVVNGKMMMQFGMIRKEQLLNSLSSKRITTITELNSPTAVALWKDTIVVLDSGNNRVKTFTLKGEKLLEFGQSGSLKGYFKYPEVMTIDKHGFILVGDGGNCRVHIFRSNGQFVSSIGARGGEPGKFNWVSGIAVTDDFEIITSDYKNHAVQIFQ